MKVSDTNNPIQCPVCQVTDDEYNRTCQCGYNFDQKMITDQAKIREYVWKFKADRSWVNEIRAKKRVHEVQQTKYGRSHVGTSWGWRVIDTADLLGEGKSNIADDFKLADALESHPELAQCASKIEARRREKELPEHLEVFEAFFGKQFNSEIRLHRFIENNWDKIRFFGDWELKQSKFSTGDAGEIDLLSYNRQGPIWRVIEIKKGRSPDATVGQTLRYMGWVKENLAEAGDEVRGLVISGYPPDRFIRYAILAAQNIEYWIYYLKEGELELMTAEEAYKLYLDPSIDHYLSSKSLSE